MVNWESPFKTFEEFVEMQRRTRSCYSCDAIWGHFGSQMASISQNAPHIKAGKARVLIVFDSKRFAGLPDVPCSKEKDYDISGLTHVYNVLVLRKGTSQNVVAIMEKAMGQAAADPKAKQSLVEWKFRRHTRRLMNEPVSVHNCRKHDSKQIQGGTKDENVNSKA
jgi:hypothetical protein